MFEWALLPSSATGAGGSCLAAGKEAMERVSHGCGRRVNPKPEPNL